MLDAGELDLLTRNSVDDGNEFVLMDGTHDVMVGDSGGFDLVCAKLLSSVDGSSLSDSESGIGDSGLSGSEGACSEVSDEADVMGEAGLEVGLVGLELKTPVVVGVAVDELVKCEGAVSSSWARSLAWSLIVSSTVFYACTPWMSVAMTKYSVLPPRSHLLLELCEVPLSSFRSTPLGFDMDLQHV